MTYLSKTEVVNVLSHFSSLLEYVFLPLVPEDSLHFTVEIEYERLWKMSSAIDNLKLDSN